MDIKEELQAKLKGLSVEELVDELERTQHKIKHLNYSNEQLKIFIEDQDSTEEDKLTYQEAYDENVLVIERMKSRLSVIQGIVSGKTGVDFNLKQNNQNDKKEPDVNEDESTRVNGIHL